MADTKVTALTALSVPALEDLLYAVDDPSGTPLSRSVTADRLGGLYLPGVCQGRLTTESGVPVSGSDRTAQSTLYFTPYGGDRVALYDGTRWKLYAFTERNLPLSGLTSARPYDVFLYDNASTLMLELLAWTNATTRATALVAQDGVYVKTGATTRRYVGTIYTTSATTTADAEAFRYVWNAQQRVARSVKVVDPANTWTYSVANTWRQANANTANQVGVVAGLAVSMINLYVSGLGNVTSGGKFQGIGRDSTTVSSAQLMSNQFVSGLALAYATLTETVAIGAHVYPWLEQTDTGSATTFYGDNGTPTVLQFGMTGTWEC